MPGRAERGLWDGMNSMRGKRVVIIVGASSKLSIGRNEKAVARDNEEKGATLVIVTKERLQYPRSRSG